MKQIEGWLGFSRPPFHTLGVLPFCLGTFIAWHRNHVFHTPAFVLSLIGIVMVMIATCYAEEYVRLAEQERSKYPSMGFFSGGSVPFPGSLFRDSTPFRTSFIATAVALLIGIILQFGLATGHLTLALGCLGAMPGVFYAARPLTRVDQGYGEVLIASIYGWLPVAAAFYIQQGFFDPGIHRMALPIGLSIFNVILLNEFPAHAIRASGGARNLLHRLGKPKGAALYCLTSTVSWFAMYASLGAGIPRKTLYIYIPVMILSAVISLMMAGRRYENPLVLEILCGLNIAVYLGTVAVYFLALL